MYNDKKYNKTIKYEDERYVVYKNGKWLKFDDKIDYIFNKIHKIIEEKGITIPIIKDFTDDYDEDSCKIKYYDEEEDEGYEDESIIYKSLTQLKFYRRLLQYFLKDPNCFNDHSLNIIN